MSYATEMYQGDIERLEERIKKLEAERDRLLEKMEYMRRHMRGYDHEHTTHAKINSWFDSDGKALKES